MCNMYIWQELRILYRGDNIVTPILWPSIPVERGWEEYCPAYVAQGGIILLPDRATPYLSAECARVNNSLASLQLTSGPVIYRY